MLDKNFNAGDAGPAWNGFDYSYYSEDHTTGTLIINTHGENNEPYRQYRPILTDLVVSADGDTIFTISGDQTGVKMRQHIGSKAPFVYHPRSHKMFSSGESVYLFSSDQRNMYCDLSFYYKL